MKRKSFCLNCKTDTRFQHIRNYLQNKYSVYTAIFENGVGYFKIAYFVLILFIFSSCQIRNMNTCAELTRTQHQKHLK